MSSITEYIVLITCIAVFLALWFGIPKLFEISETLKEILKRMKNPN